MIAFERFELQNGLKVIIHEDKSTPMVAVNVLYNVGSRDESPEKTGFAHLFEHLMFSGSKHISDFDEPIQQAGGENNAFTNNDITNFYDILPAQNIETALWLESDRMLSLNFNDEALEIQRKVVLEELKETTELEPYGDVWHHLGEMAFKSHPYRWPTIGKSPNHLEDVKMDDVKAFYHKYYHPANAILTLCGHISVKEGRQLIEKWFGDIPAGEPLQRRLPIEPPQEKLEKRLQEADVPSDALYMAFHCHGRDDNRFYVADLLSDILSHSRSARLYKNLVLEQSKLSHVDAYISGSIDPGLLIIEARPSEGVSLEEASELIWSELTKLKQELVSDYELQKVKNQVESSLLFSETSILNKAINLAFFELVGNANLINEEADIYNNITAQELKQLANDIFRAENCSELVYRGKAK